MDTNNDLHQYIIDRLAAHVRANDIAMEVQLSTSMDWGEAHNLVEEVRLEYGTTINQKQVPLILVLGTVSMLAGFAFLIAGANNFAQFVVAYLPGGLSPLEVLGAIFNALEMTNHFIGQAIIGSALIIGSYLGMRTTWAAILEKTLENF